MRKHGTKAAVFLGTSLPWAFFGMYGDAELGTVALYAVMVLCLGGLWWLAAKGKCLYMAAPGTAVSVVLSHICITEFATEKWSWFFKPLTAQNFAVVISIGAMLAGLVLSRILTKRK